MNPLFKKIVIVMVIVIIVIAIYFGSFLPLRKSQSLVRAMRSVGAARTVDDLEKILSQSLDFYSPVGQDESMRQVATLISDVLTRQKDFPREIADELLNFSVKYFNPVIESGYGGNLSRNFVILGQIYQVAGFRYNDSAYFEKAVDYYKQGLIYSPNRPQFLYNLFNIYLNQKNFASAKEIGEQITRYWPNDNKIKEELNKI